MPQGRMLSTPTKRSTTKTSGTCVQERGMLIDRRNHRPTRRSINIPRSWTPVPRCSFSFVFDETQPEHEPIPRCASRTPRLVSCRDQKKKPGQEQASKSSVLNDSRVGLQLRRPVDVLLSDTFSFPSVFLVSIRPCHSETKRRSGEENKHPRAAC